MRVVRAIVAWLVVSLLLLFAMSLFGLISTYEVVLALVVGPVLAVLALRFWDRRRSRRPEGMPRT